MKHPTVAPAVGTQAPMQMGRIRDVAQLTTLSPRQIHLLEAKDSFPKSKMLGPRVRAWDLGEVRAWLAACPTVKPSRPREFLAADAKRPAGARRRRDLERDNEMARMYTAGASLAVVGEEFAVSGERVRQILVRLGVPARPITKESAGSVAKRGRSRHVEPTS